MNVFGHMVLSSVWRPFHPTKNKQGYIQGQHLKPLVSCPLCILPLYLDQTRLTDCARSLLILQLHFDLPVAFLGRGKPGRKCAPVILFLETRFG